MGGGDKNSVNLNQTTAEKQFDKGLQYFPKKQVG